MFVASDGSRYESEFKALRHELVLKIGHTDTKGHHISKKLANQIIEKADEIVPILQKLHSLNGPVVRRPDMIGPLAPIHQRIEDDRNHEKTTR